MKNHEEFRKAVFEKAAAYEKQRKLKRQRALRIAVSVCTCMVFALIIALVPIKTLVSDRKTVDEYTTSDMGNYSNGGESSTVEPTPTPTSTTATTAETMATMATTTTTATTTIAQTTQTTSTTATYATKASTAPSTTTEVATIATTTEAATTATSSTATPTIKEYYYYNGALTIEAAATYGLCDKPEVVNKYIITSTNGLSKKEKEYFSESFFETNSLICIIVETENPFVVPLLAGAQFTEDGVNVFIDVPENEKMLYNANWSILIPVPNTLVSPDMTITVELSR